MPRHDFQPLLEGGGADGCGIGESGAGFQAAISEPLCYAGGVSGGEEAGAGQGGEIAGDGAVCGADPEDGARQRGGEGELAGPEEAAGLGFLGGHKDIGSQQGGGKLVLADVGAPIAAGQAEGRGVFARGRPRWAATLEDQAPGSARGLQEALGIEQGPPFMGAA